MSRFIIYHCSREHLWLVAVNKGDYYLGVADCPDKRTAIAVRYGLYLRDQDKLTEDLWKEERKV